jgi:hypothetical protein
MHELHPPNSQAEADALFNPQTAHSTYGQDFFDWYRGVLLEHARLVGEAAMSVFSEGALARTTVGYKIPGVHWSMHNRYAELTSGLLSTRAREVNEEWARIDAGMGYRPVFETLGRLREAYPSHGVRFYFTAGMTPNGNDGQLPVEQSRAEDLAHAMLVLAHAQHLGSGLENALDSDLTKPWHVDLLKRVMSKEGYASAALLRINDVLASDVLRAALREIHSWQPLKCEWRLLYL